MKKLLGLIILSIVFYSVISVWLLDEESSIEFKTELNDIKNQVKEELGTIHIEVSFDSIFNKTEKDIKQDTVQLKEEENIIIDENKMKYIIDEDGTRYVLE